MKLWGIATVVGVALLVLGISYSAYSQQEIGGQGQRGGRHAMGQRGMGGGGRGPGMMGPGMGMMSRMKVGAQGLFVLQGPTLLKYDPATLALKGQLALADPAAEQAAAGDGNGQPMGHPKPIAFLPAGDDVLVVAGDTFIRVDGKTMQKAVTGTLPTVTLPTPPDNAGDGMAPPPPNFPPMLELNGTTLYVERGPSLVAVNTADGTVTAKATLPTPANMPTPPAE